MRLTQSLYVALTLTRFTLAGEQVQGAPQGVQYAAPTATLREGIYVGQQTSLPGSPVNLNKWNGIPFAKPPERFAPPQALDISVEAKRAVRPMNQCMQLGAGIRHRAYTIRHSTNTISQKVHKVLSPPYSPQTLPKVKTVSI